MLKSKDITAPHERELLHHAYLTHLLAQGGSLISLSAMALDGVTREIDERWGRPIRAQIQASAEATVHFPQMIPPTTNWLTQTKTNLTILRPSSPGLPLEVRRHVVAAGGRR